MSLGFDHGTKMKVVWVKDGKMDVDVPALDMRISGIRTDHPDLCKVDPRASSASVMGIDSLRLGPAKKTKAQLDWEIDRTVKKRKHRF